MSFNHRLQEAEIVTMTPHIITHWSGNYEDSSSAIAIWLFLNQKVIQERTN